MSEEIPRSVIALRDSFLEHAPADWARRGTKTYGMTLCGPMFVVSAARDAKSAPCTQRVTFEWSDRGLRRFDDHVIHYRALPTVPRCTVSSDLGSFSARREEIERALATTIQSSEEREGFVWLVFVVDDRIFVQSEAVDGT